MGENRDPILRQIDECCDLAREADAAGDVVTFIAATSLAAQLCQLARIRQRSATIISKGQENE
jgi:hypothetical protein